MKVACVVLGSGNSTRFNKSKSKLFYKVYGTPIIEYTLKNISKFIKKNSIYITIPKKISKIDEKLIKKYTSNNLIFGGKNRYYSLKNALNNINSAEYDYVMIHDAARPLTSKNLFFKMVNACKTNKYTCIIPSSPLESTIRRNFKSVNRAEYSYYQTPQIIHLKTLLKNIAKIKYVPTDDFGILEHMDNIKVKFFQCEKENIKITRLEDVNLFKKLLSSRIKIGNGFDLHKLKAGNYLSLAGLKLKSKYTAIGHSDGDVVLHALIDAILGCKIKGDIGKYYPATEENKNISSVILMNQIKKMTKMNNVTIDHLDCTIICQTVRLEKHKENIAKNLAKLLDCSRTKINIKAKTADKVGTIGKSRAIACWLTLKLIDHA